MELEAMPEVAVNPASELTAEPEIVSAVEEEPVLEAELKPEAMPEEEPIVEPEVDVIPEQDMHGIGLSNVRREAEKYMGELELKVDQQIFSATVLLQERSSL